jgi:ethanolamine ammonia-lyase small subunit
MPDSLTKAPPPTTARLSLGNTSPAQSTADHLRFQLDHALARDAVHTPLDTAALQRGLTARGFQPVLLRSAASAAAQGQGARRTYLRRPDLGRTLHPDSLTTLQALASSAVISTAAQRSGETPVFGTTTEPGPPGPDSRTRDANLSDGKVLILLADGLSALALERHALPLLDALPSSLRSTLYPLIPVLQHARVAIADPIGQILGAQITVLLIGERPGLSSPDSLGCYITWSPRPGRTDAERNCISNIRGPEGLSYAEAAHRIAHYLQEAQRLQTTGTALKDPTTNPSLPHTA